MIGEKFDLYCAASAAPFREGAIVSLDGIDGFYDQYFDGRPVGEIIRFAVLVSKPADMPRSIEELNAMPFVTARITNSDDIGGDVEVLSRTTLEQWCRSLELPPETRTELQSEFRDAAIHDLVAQATRDGSAYWRRGAKYWRSLSETSAVGAVRDGATILVTALRTYGAPGLVARVNPPTT